MSKLGFILIWFSVLSIGICKPTTGSSPDDDILPQIVHNLTEKALNVGYKLVKTVGGNIFKIAWGAAVGPIVAPISIPLQFFGKALNFLDDLLHEIGNSLYNAIKEVNTNDRDDTSVARRRRRRSTSSLAEYWNILQSIIINVFETVYRKIYRSQLFRWFVTLTLNIYNFLRPLMHYITDDLLPQIVELLIVIQNSEYISDKSLRRIDTIKQVYELMSLLGIVPPLNLFLVN